MFFLVVGIFRLICSYLAIICTFCSTYHSETNGIATHTLNARIEIHGPNCIPPPKELHIVLKFILCFFTGFGPLLWIACFFVFLSWQPFGTPPSNVYNLALAIALLLVIFISGKVILLLTPTETGCSPMIKLCPWTCVFF